jgi:hypothetical protein
MRDYSRVSPRIWTGETGRRLRGKKNEQILAFYLITCPSANMIGLFYLPIPAMVHETGMSIEDTRGALKWLYENGVAHYDEDQEIVWIPAMARWQIADSLKPNDKQVVGVRRELEQYLQHPFAQLFLRRYGAKFHIGIEPLPAAPAPPSKGLPRGENLTQVPLRSQDQDQEQEQEQEPLPSPFEDQGPDPGQKSGSEKAPPPVSDVPRTGLDLQRLHERMRVLRWQMPPRPGSWDARDANVFMSNLPPGVEHEIKPALIRFFADDKPHYVRLKHPLEVFCKDFDAFRGDVQQPKNTGPVYQLLTPIPEIDPAGFKRGDPGARQWARDQQAKQEAEAAAAAPVAVAT